MNSDLEKLIGLQQVDARIAALRAEISALPRHVQQIEAKLAGSKTKLEAAQAAMKADETARRKHESDIQDQQQKISKYRDQSLNVKTNQEYRALMDEIKFAEDKIAASEDKILEIMVATDARKEGLKQADAVLKADTAENDKEKEAARLRTAEDEKELAELSERRKQLRAEVTEDVLRHYDRVSKLRGSALSAVHEDQMCSVCRLMLRPQVFQDVMRNDQFVTCDSCQRILYFVPPPPKAEVLDLPEGEYRLIRFLQQKPREWPAWFSANVKGEVWPGVNYGPTPLDTRLDVRGISEVLDKVINIYLHVRPGGGRFFVSDEGVFYKDENADPVQFIKFNLAPGVPSKIEELLRAELDKTDPVSSAPA
jgi:predicted  nucleic acid-binding Zn-ribbon protein